MDPKILAQNLRKPSGETGVYVSEMMEKGNVGFYDHFLKIKDLSKVHSMIEYGFGGAAHVDRFLKSKADLKYVGVDYSETMVSIAKSKFPHLDFHYSTVDEYESKQGFDVALLVNVVYFLDNLEYSFNQIKKNLSSNGKIYIGKRTQEDLIQLDGITQYGFNRYSHQEVIDALRKTGFNAISVFEQKEPSITLNQVSYQLHSDFIVGTIV